MFYLATKDGMTCRIPEAKAEYYKEMGYDVTPLEKVKADAKEAKKAKDSEPVKKA